MTPQPTTTPDRAVEKRVLIDVQRAEFERLERLDRAQRLAARAGGRGAP